jgi:hypothetical protein
LCHNNDRTYDHEPCSSHARINYEVDSAGWFHYQVKGCERQEAGACAELSTAVLPQSLHYVLGRRSYLEDHQELRQRLQWQAPKCREGDALSCKLMASDMVVVARLEADVRKRMAASDPATRDRLEALVGAMRSATSIAKVPADVMTAAEREAASFDRKPVDDPGLRKRLLPVLLRYCRNGKVTPDSFEALGEACFVAGLLHMAVAADGGTPLAPAGGPQHDASVPQTAAGYPTTEDGLLLAAIACTTHGNDRACTFAKARGMKVDEAAGHAHAAAMSKRWEALNESRGRYNEIRERHASEERRIQREAFENDLERQRRDGHAQIQGSREAWQQQMDGFAPPSGAGAVTGSSGARAGATADGKKPSGAPVLDYGCKSNVASGTAEEHARECHRSCMKACTKQYPEEYGRPTSECPARCANAAKVPGTNGTKKNGCPPGTPPGKVCAVRAD